MANVDNSFIILDDAGIKKANKQKQEVCCKKRYTIFTSIVIFLSLIFSLFIISKIISLNVIIKRNFQKIITASNNLFRRKQTNNNKKISNGNIGLNPNYQKIDPNHIDYTYIPIVGIDDVHGNFFPRVNKIKIGNNTLIYKTGGFEYIAKYINILREEFGSHRVLFFDSGDFYQGGFDSIITNGEIMQDLYNLIGVNGSTIGNHEFDYDRKWLE